MKAVAYQQCLPIAHAESLLDVDLPEPAPGPHDLLVEIRAVAANPLDTKMRARAQPAPGHWKVLGWDASGMVRAVGADVTLFQPGDRVWYAGSLQRPGSNSEVHLVDERLAGIAPKSLDFAAAAALPLTAITAWEMLSAYAAPLPADVAAHLQQVAWETVQEYGAKWRVRAVLLSGAWESGIVFNVLGTPAPCTQHVAPTNVRYQ